MLCQSFVNPRAVLPPSAHPRLAVAHPAKFVLLVSDAPPAPPCLLSFELLPSLRLKWCFAIGSTPCCGFVNPQLCYHVEGFASSSESQDRRLLVHSTVHASHQSPPSSPQPQDTSKSCTASVGKDVCRAITLRVKNQDSNEGTEVLQTNVFWRRGAVAHLSLAHRRMRCDKVNQGTLGVQLWKKNL